MLVHTVAFGVGGVEKEMGKERDAGAFSKHETNM